MTFVSGTDHVILRHEPQPESTIITSEKSGDLTTTEKKDEKVEVIVNVNELPNDVVLEAPSSSSKRLSKENLKHIGAVLLRFLHFTGPGTLISVAYVDPDNFQTALDAGAQFQYKLLFVILLGVFMAIYLQALAAKVGCVTGLNLAQLNRAYLPRWLNYSLYGIAEAAIICTDIGQVIGTAIAINLLIPKVPLWGGCLISVTDTLFILLFYNADGTLRRLRVFEGFVSIFIIGVFVSFCIELSLMKSDAGEVFKGYLPSKEIFTGAGPFQSCAILGGILMPHSLYLGSGLVQKRMQTFDHSLHGHTHSALPSTSKFAIPLYRPTLTAIKSCMSYSIAELCVSLFIVTLFINSAILIVAASSLSSAADEADLPGVYRLFVSTIGQASGTLFACALLFSGVSAGIVCTMAGQLVCEGALDWRMRPFYRRLLTRSMSIVPAVVVSASQGQHGLAVALNACNVVLSVALIFLTFPLIWYTSWDKYMRVSVDDNVALGVVDGVLNMDTERAFRSGEGWREGSVSLANGWVTTVVAWGVWLVVAGFNVTTLTFLGLGIGGES